MNRQIFAGLDIGSLSTEVVVLGPQGIMGYSIVSTGSNSQRAIRSSLDVALNHAGVSQSHLSGMVATGYGRFNLPFPVRQITEITCHAKGAFFINPKIRTIIDIGGQDSKVIQIDDHGQVRDFEMNDKCSAGTGRFLEVMANALEVEIADFGTQALISTNPASISSTCTVFAESEVISRLNQGADRLDIIAGIHRTIAIKIAALTARVGINSLVALTGGVALNPGVRKMLENQLNVTIEVPDNPQMIGALGAALIASERLQED